MKDIFIYAPYIWLGSIGFMGVKMLYDQIRLLQLYRKEVNPPYQLLFHEMPGVDYPETKVEIHLSPLYLIKIALSKYENNPTLALQAQKVRRDFLAGILIGVNGFIIIGIFAYLSAKSS